eukprot:239994_1
MAAKKRTHKCLESNESISITEPLHKKQKTEATAPENGFDSEEKIEISVTMSTKLGASQRTFNSKDLKQIAYFENYYSGRWNSDNQCTVTNLDICCSVNEIEALIFYNKHHKINAMYPIHRLIYFCMAADYFAHAIPSDTFKAYFESCIPAVKYNDLAQCRKACDGIHSCSNLLSAVDVTMKQISHHEQSLKKQIIQNWVKVPIELLISNEHTAATIFVQNFRFVAKEFTFSKRDACDLSAIWRYLCDNKTYRKYPKIFEVIYALKAAPTTIYNPDPPRLHHHPEIAKAVTNIIADLLRITMKYKINKMRKKNYEMIDNIFTLQTPKNAAYSIRIPHCKFIFVILHRLTQLRASDELKYHHCFSRQLIHTLLNKNFNQILGVARNREFMKDLEALNVSQRLYPSEKLEVLQSILKYHQINGSGDAVYKQKMQSLIQRLVVSDYDKTFKMAKLWFPIMMKEYKKWIINDLPKALPLPTLQILISGICEYITSTEHKKLECDSAYFEFINQYTNSQWNVPK